MDTMGHASTKEPSQIESELAEALVLYEKGEFDQAYDIWEQLAKDYNSPEAMYQIGVFFKEGKNKDDKEPEPDMEEAISWFKDASKAGHLKAAFELAEAYEEKKDYEKAAKTLEKLAKAGGAEAMLKLGKLYRELLGKKEKGMYYLLKAGDAGLAEAQYP
jgi:TPR repeat protein